MNNVNITTTNTISGLVSGTTASPNSSCRVSVRRTNSYTQATTAKIDQILDKATSTFTIASSTTLAIDLTTGQINPLNESISSSLAFVKVRYVMVEHDAASLSTGIVAFGSGSNQFQGPLSASATVTLIPGGKYVAENNNATGWTVNGSNKTIQIVNSSATQSATVRLIVAGSTT
jgi:hypothetical protein